MTSLAVKLRTYRALGLGNLARVFRYRAAVRAGRFPARADPIRPGQFFAPARHLLEDVAPQAWLREGHAFGHHRIALTQDLPDTLADPLSGKSYPMPQRPWFTLPDFDSSFGDIKLIWELSRLGWALPIARRAAGGDTDELNRLNAWLRAWAVANPAWQGPNWKCGQEASIRVMHLSMAAVVLGSVGATEPPLLDLIKQHVVRIAPTMGYARAQDNNHGTSEAAGLFIGGSWLEAHGHKECGRFAAQGRAALEERVAALVQPDGSFSQHSLTYHRVLIDTLVMAEIWRQALGLSAFSNQFLARTRAATQWLGAMILSPQGDGPNFGANDGAHLLSLSDEDYRDFRPSYGRAARLFLGLADAGHGAVDTGLSALRIAHSTGAPTLAPSPQSRLFDDGGIALLKRKRATAMLRYARFKFRPSQCDVNHVDLWVDGRAVLRDGGSFSYSTQEAIGYFAGVAGHNTVQFDETEQMPRLGRFLVGDWLDAGPVSPIEETDAANRFRAGYVNRGGQSHYRSVELRDGELIVIDDIAGFKHEATFRWRLCPAEWTFENGWLEGSGLHISIESDQQYSARLDEGRESLYYMQSSQVPIFCISVTKPGRYITRIKWL